MEEQHITSVLKEERIFKPPKNFSKNAHIKSIEKYKKIYNYSIKNPEKFWAEKAEQLQFGHKDKKGMVFVIFDYSVFSGLGTQRPLALADALLKIPTGLQAMKPYTSYLRQMGLSVVDYFFAVLHFVLALLAYN